jgi:hypothetical protein
MFNPFKKKALIDPKRISITTYGIEGLLEKYKGTATLYSHFVKWEAFNGKLTKYFAGCFNGLAKQIDEDSKWTYENLGYEKKAQHIIIKVFRGANPEYGKPREVLITMNFYLTPYGMFEKKAGGPKYSGRDKFGAIAGAVMLADVLAPEASTGRSMLRAGVIGAVVGKYMDHLNDEADEKSMREEEDED